MELVGLNVLQSEVATLKPVRWVGRVIEIGQGTIIVSGLSKFASFGDLVEFQTPFGKTLRGEVLRLDDEKIVVLPDGNSDGLQINDRIFLIGKNEISPHESWVGRIIDPHGNSLDGFPVLKGSEPRTLLGEPINPTERRGLGSRLETGLKVFNTILPIVRGQRIGLFAGSGVGKSTLLGKLTTGMDTDIVVFALVGERGREVKEFVQKILGNSGMKKSIVVASTSDQSPLSRRRCAWAAMSVAEYFRDLGRQVLFVMDSVTRFAEAHREVALAAGESATLRGYPPSTAAAIMQLCERAGPGSAYSGDITAIFSVLVAGSDMEEPVADIVRGVLDGHIVLDRQIAERGRFPAVDLLRSVSRALPDAASESENKLISRARQHLGTFERNEMMISAGLYLKGSDAEIDMARLVWPKLDTFIGESEQIDIISSYDSLSDCLDVKIPDVTNAISD